MLAGKRRRAELPVDLPRPAIDHHNGRYVAEAEHNIPVGQFAEPIGERPPVTVVLNGRYAVFNWIEMLPALPFPDDFSICRHLHEVIAHDLAVVDFGSRAAAVDLRDDRIRKRPLADKKDVAILKSDAVVSVVGMM